MIIIQDDDEDVNKCCNDENHTDGNVCLKRNGSRKGVGFPKFLSPTPKEKKIIINVSGQVFKIDADVLDKHPHTMLGNPRRRHRYFDEKRKEYFLDRHRATFEVVLAYYNNGGVISRPDDIPIDIFINELKFYSFDRETLEKFLREEGILHVETKKALPSGKIRKYLWKLFEDHEGSLASQIVTIISAIVIIVSVVVFCLETLDEFKSFSHNMTHQFPIALSSCQNEGLRLSRDQTTLSTTKASVEMIQGHLPFLKFHDLQRNVSVVSVLSIFSISQLTIFLEDLLKNCQHIVNTLQHKYALKRCLIELEDEKKKSAGIFEDMKLILPFTILQKYALTTGSSSSSDFINDTISNEKPVEHSTESYVSYTFMNSAAKKPTVMKNISGLFPLNAINNRQAVVFAEQACLNLDRLSNKTPYEWLVLEGRMGSPAGVLFLTETVCIFWFVTELILRFLSAPNKKKFAKVSLKSSQILIIFEVLRRSV